MHWIVCVKVVPKTEQLRFDLETRRVDRRAAENLLNPPDKDALEWALRLRERHGGRVTLVSMGPPGFLPFLHLALAMGADRAVLLSDRALAGSDTLATSLALARAIQALAPWTLALCGEASADGGTGQVPPGIAEWLDVPHVTRARELEVLPEGWARVRRALLTGHEVVEVPLPAVVAVTAGSAPPRFPDFRRLPALEAESPVEIWDLERLGLRPEEVGQAGSPTEVIDLIPRQRPARRRIWVKGSPEEQARKVLEVLREVLGPLGAV